MPRSNALFRQKAPAIMFDLIADFGIEADDAAAIVGNAGHECLGFTTLQEIKPTVAGSKGGYGWFQWTGSRRRAFEAYCLARHIHPASDEGNYGFLCEELRGSQRAAIAAVKRATTLEGKVIAFEGVFERAGVKHYESRQKWARIALDEYGRTHAPQPEPEQPSDEPEPEREPDPQPDPVPVPSDRAPDEPAPAPQAAPGGFFLTRIAKRFWGRITGIGGGLGLGALYDWRVVTVLVVAVVGIAIMVIRWIGSERVKTWIIGKCR